MYNVIMLEIIQLTFALPTTVVCNQFTSTCKVISQKWRSPLQLFGQQHMTPDKVKVEVMYKLFHQHMPPDKVKVWKSWASWRWRVRAEAALAAEGEEEHNQGYQCLMKSFSRYFPQLRGQIHCSFGFYLFSCGSYSRGRGGTQLRQAMPNAVHALKIGAWLAYSCVVLAFASCSSLGPRSFDNLYCLLHLFDVVTSLELVPEDRWSANMHIPCLRSRFEELLTLGASLLEVIHLFPSSLTLEWGPTEEGKMWEHDLGGPSRWTQCMSAISAQKQKTSQIFLQRIA